jgi:hypothetical protein
MAGSNMATKMPRMQITTRTSTRVNALRFILGLLVVSVSPFSPIFAALLGINRVEVGNGFQKDSVYVFDV